MFWAAASPERNERDSDRIETMQTQHQSQTHIPFHPKVSFDVRQAVMEERLAAELTIVKQTGVDARKAQLITTAHQESIIRAIGGDKYEMLHAYSKDQKRCKAKLFSPPRGPAMSRDEVKRFKTERKAEALAWAEHAGIDVRHLQTLNREVETRLRALDPGRAYQTDKPSVILSPFGLPPGIHADMAIPWTVARPPYGWSWWYESIVAGFSFTPTLYLDANIGLIGNINHIEDTDASDNDYAHVKYATNVSFWYQMPTAGLIEVWIEAQSRDAHHRVVLEDEWGWSDCSVNQHNYLTLNASVGGSVSDLQLRETSWFTESGGNEGNWDNTYIADGSTFWANLTTDPRTIFQAGVLRVLVEVGHCAELQQFARQ